MFAPAQMQENLRLGFLWLGSLDYSVEYGRNKKLHTKGTSGWIVKDEEYLNWAQKGPNKASLLWISGQPGMSCVLLAQ